MRVRRSPEAEQEVQSGLTWEFNWQLQGLSNTHASGNSVELACDGIQAGPGRILYPSPLDDVPQTSAGR